MKDIYIKYVFLVLMVCGANMADAQDYKWVKRTGGKGTHSGAAISTDGHGNIYVAANIDDSTHIGDTLLSHQECFVAKYSPDGEVENVYALRGCTATGLAADYAGNTFLCGYFQDSLVFDSVTLYSHGGTDVFIAAFDTAGVNLWAKNAGSDEDDRANAIAIDAIGNTYITGHFVRNANFGNALLTSVGDADAFVAKYDTIGNFIWAHKGGGSGFDEGTGLSSDAFGEVYVTGNFSGPAEFDNKKVNGVGGTDIFVGRYSSSGVLKWLKQAGGFGEDRAQGIGINGAGYSYITGRVEGDAAFDEYKVAGAGTSDIFIVGYDPEGKALWANVAGGPGDEDAGQAIAVDGEGNAYVTGRFSQTASFGGLNIESDGNETDIFLVKYNAAGKIQWVEKAGGDLKDQGTAIALDASKEIYFTGEVTGQASFRQQTLEAEAGGSFFISRVTQQPSALQEAEAAPVFTFYPNPSRGNINLKCENGSAAPVHISIYGLEGRQLFTTATSLWNGQAALDVSFLPDGMYILQITGNGYAAAERLMIRR